jgi:hypothetical protein
MAWTVWTSQLCQYPETIMLLSFYQSKISAAAKFDIPRCSICEFARAKRRPKHAQYTTTTAERDGALKKDNLRVGAEVSVDHFESRLRGRTYDSYGKKQPPHNMLGVASFFDHGYGYIQVRNQVGFSAVETIRAKKSMNSLL